jgi:hypothetical protein
MTADGTVATTNANGQKVSATTTQEFAAVIYGHGYVELGGDRGDFHIVSDFNAATWWDNERDARDGLRRAQSLLRGMGFTVTEHGGGLRIQMVHRRVYHETTLPEIVGDPPKHTCADRTSAELDPDCPGCMWES